MLHVTNGDCAAARIRAAIPGAEVLPWRDILHDGPVPVGLDLEALSEVRAGFVSAETGLERATVSESFRSRDERLSRALSNGEELQFWFEHDLYDQLQLVQLLAICGQGRGRCAIVQADDYLDRLSNADLSERGGRAPLVSDDQWQVGQRAWAAFSASAPLSLAELLDEDTSPLPFAGCAIERLLEEFPGRGNGLTRTERVMLQLLAEGPSPRVQLFESYSATEAAMWLGDLPFFRRLDGLGGLIGRTGDELYLTEAGRAVLDGRVDRVVEVPIDRWIGGTHLQPGRIWRWDAVARRLSLD